jgi:hypothetical protein
MQQADTTGARSEHFNDSVQSVHESRPAPISPITFHPTSVLQPVAQSGVGYSEADHQRKLMGIASSPNGQSRDTYQESAYLRYPFMRF